MNRSKKEAPDPSWKVQAGSLEEEEEPSKLKQRSSGRAPGKVEQNVPRRARPCPPYSRPLWVGPESPPFDGTNHVLAPTPP